MTRFTHLIDSKKKYQWFKNPLTTSYNQSKTPVQSWVEIRVEHTLAEKKSKKASSKETHCLNYYLIAMIPQNFIVKMQKRQLICKVTGKNKIPPVYGWYFSRGKRNRKTFRGSKNLKMKKKILEQPVTATSTEQKKKRNQNILKSTIQRKTTI